MAGPTTYTKVVNGVTTTITAEEYNARKAALNTQADQLRNSLRTPAAQDTQAITAVSAAQATQAIAAVDPVKLDQNTTAVTQTARSAVDRFTDPSKLPVDSIAALGQAGHTARLLPNNSFDNIARAQGLNFAPEPNPLNQYANYTYHIRWFMTSVDESYNNIGGTNPNSSNMAKTVIAESGVTAGFNITELHIHAACTTSNEKRNMWSLTEIDLVLHEPLGLSLLDKIYYSAQQIGIRNHLRCPYFLEVWFNGYNEDGSLAANNLYYNIYRINFQDVDANATHVGTIYNIKFYADNSTGESNQLAIPAAGINVPANNLGAFFDDLTIALNAQPPQSNNDGIKRTVYKFQYPNTWKNWSMRPKDPDRHVSRNESVNAADAALGTGSVIKIASGQAIETIINNAVYSCKEAQDFITGNNGGSTGGASFGEHALIGYVAVRAVTKLISVDPVSGDYTREITYVMWRAESLKSYTDPQAVKDASTPQIQSNKLQYMVQKKRLNKRYDYIYTGLNTEVVSFDFKVNMTYMFANPAWAQANAYGQYATPALVNEGSVGRAQQTQTLPQEKVPANTIDAVKPDSVSPANAITTAVGTAPANAATNLLTRAGTAITNVIKNTTNQLAAASVNIPLNASPGQLAGYQALLNAQGKTAAAQLVQTQRNYLASKQSRLTAYAEDAKNNPAATPPLPLVATFPNEPLTQNAQQNTDQIKVPVDTDALANPSGTGFVAAVMGNLFAAGPAEFMNIEITVRGDPWWIPTSNISQNDRALELTGNNTNKSANSNQLQADFLAGDNAFLLQLRPGVVIDESTGLAVTDGNGSDFFKGIYVLYEVDCQFVGGKFTQLLKAYKDVLSQNPIPNQTTVGTASGTAAAASTRAQAF